MKKSKRLVSLILTLCLAFTLVSVPASAEASTVNAGVKLAGNNCAFIEATHNITSIDVDASLASVQIDSKTACITAITDKQAIVDAVIKTSAGSISVQIPLGYTTFVFNGDKLTVYEGGDDKYEIAGINTANEEYLTDDATYTLPVTYDAQGNAVYSNTDNYSINVAVKKKGGSYVFCGQSSDMSISVKKEATGDAQLILAGLDLTSSFTAPVTVKKDSTAAVEIFNPKGFINTLTDAELNNEDLHGEAGTVDNLNPEYAESAVIKGKSVADITICGEGTLNLDCHSKNAVKVSEYGNLTLKDVSLNVSSVNHGISSDNTMTITSGNINVVCESDGIRSNPDTVDETLGASGSIVINGGNISVLAGSDGIQASQQLTVTDGSFSIKTGNGYNDSSFNSNTQSCKGLKVSPSNDETSSTADLTCSMNISGGSFYLNCADDALHSDSYISITGGSFVIFTGDDGVHADTTLDVGTQNSTAGIPVINIKSSYEGLESGTVNIYGGTISVVASDDGINSAGGSDSTDNNTGFNPGGMRPGMGNQGNQGNQGNASTGSFSINIYGGKIVVNAYSDGLDSNGALNLLGGEIVVSGASSGDGEPLDRDGTMTINGATVLALGQRGTGNTTSSSGAQRIITSSTSVSAGKAVNVSYNGNVVYSATAPKNCSYIIFSSPNLTSTNGWSISTSSATTASCSHSSVATANLFSDFEDFTSGGSYVQAAYCAVCGSEISRTTVYIPAEITPDIPSNPDIPTVAPVTTAPTQVTDAVVNTDATEASKSTSADSNTDATTVTNGNVSTEPHESDSTNPSSENSNNSNSNPTDGVVPSISTDAIENSTTTSDNTGASIPNPDTDIVLGYILGDSDENDVVNIKDATTIQKVLAKFDGIEYNHKASLTNSNDRLDIGDATQIQKYLANLLDDDTLIGTFVRE